MRVRGIAERNERRSLRDYVLLTVGGCFPRFDFEALTVKAEGTVM